MPCVTCCLPWTHRRIKQSNVHFEVSSEANAKQSSGKDKSQTSKHASVSQNVNEAVAKQAPFYTAAGSRAPKQVMCLFTYVCPQDKLIRLSLQLRFILDEFLILLPGKIYS